MTQAEPAPAGTAPVQYEHLSTGRGLHLAFQAALDWLRANREPIDLLNVFPVPDGDTGTNMVLTMEASLEEIRKVSSASAAEVSRAAARGALMGARGNSGVILSQIIAGLAQALEGRHQFSSHEFAGGLRRAYEVAYSAVSKPVEGTILTVARHAGAAAVDAAGRGCTVEAVLQAAVEAAESSVRNTPNLLAVLREAGVVDAGGQGLYIILEGFLKYCRGEEIGAAATIERAEDVFAAFALEHYGDEHGYCTQFLIQGSGMNVEAMRAHVEKMTDSALVVGDGELVRLHVHTDRPGDVLNYAVQFGALNRLTIDNMDLQQARHFGRAVVAPAPRKPPAANLVAVARGEGVEKILASLGARVVPGGQTMNPSTAEILQAIADCPGGEVIVLPNNANVIMSAKQAAAASKKAVRVLETRTVPHGVAAALAHNPAATLELNLKNMMKAAAAVTVFEITRATRDAKVGSVQARKGEFIGLLNGEVAAASEDLEGLLAALLGLTGELDVELATVYRGSDAKASDEDGLQKTLRAFLPEVEIEFLSGGQAHYDYVISVE